MISKVFVILTLILLVNTSLSVFAADPKIEGGKATLESELLRLTFDARGGKCVSLIAKTPGGEVELTDKTGIFEDHLGAQSYLKSDFRRGTFSMKADGAALILSADASSPEFAGVKLTKRILFANAGVVRCELKLENGSKDLRNVSLWHHQALHTKDGSTRYFVPSEEGIATLPYDPKGEPSELWFRNPARPWLGFSAGKDKTAVGGAFVGDWANWNCHFVYRSNLYATLEWRTIAKNLLPGEAFETSYQLIVVPGVNNVQGTLGESLIEATKDGARIAGTQEFAGKLAVRARQERMEIAAGALQGRDVKPAWPAGYTADDAVVS
ncbi:MAG TPA: hypothetical protein VEJ63_24000, partial [Planctomycetota bacterium]|nr:hypothetical protein [Planctomycetota bacterium]